MIPASQYIQTIGLSTQWREAQLQAYISEILEKKGFMTKLEVNVNGGRADIVSNWLGGSIIEVKKFLDREGILQASGQVQAYGYGNHRKLVIMGLLPSDPRGIDPALKAAQLVMSNPRIEVIFMNLHEDWTPQPIGAVIKRDRTLPQFKLPAFLNWGKLPSINFEPSPIVKRLLGLALAHPILVLVLLGVGYGYVHSQDQSKPVQNQSTVESKF